MDYHLIILICLRCRWKRTLQTWNNVLGIAFQIFGLRNIGT